MSGPMTGSMSCMSDTYSGPWNIRMGKQIVFWSEVEMVRTIDRINPLDLRYTTPGIDPWDEMKLGLWMLRVFYTSDLPGQLVFEGIWTPDFQRVRTPLEGTALGSNPSPPVVLGDASRKNPSLWPECRYRRPCSAEMRRISRLHNTTFAFRVKGTSEAGRRLPARLVTKLVSRHEHDARCQGRHARLSQLDE